MPAVECCVQLIHSILCTVLWTKYLVTQAVPARQPPVSFPTKDVAVLLFLLRRLTRRGIALPSKRRRLRYSTVGLTRYRTR
ncbi:hypothetical protein GNO56_15875 [Escherichia coli]|nr:hypothetical protein [Escherichia coli]